MTMMEFVSNLNIEDWKDILKLAQEVPFLVAVEIHRLCKLAEEQDYKDWEKEEKAAIEADLDAYLHAEEIAAAGIEI